MNYLCLDNSPIILQYEINAVLDVTHNARDCVGLAQRVEDATGWWAERTGRVNPRAALALVSLRRRAPRRQRRRSHHISTALTPNVSPNNYCHVRD